MQGLGFGLRLSHASFSSKHFVCEEPQYSETRASSIPVETVPRSQLQFTMLEESGGVMNRFNYPEPPCIA